MPPKKRRKDTTKPAPTKRGAPATRKRPPPPPPPPATLVSLLDRDKEVLTYFTSLNKNLNYDVDIWKDRARARESHCKQLETQVASLKQQLLDHHPPESTQLTQNQIDSANGKSRDSAVSETKKKNKLASTKEANNDDESSSFSFEFSTSSEEEPPVKKQTKSRVSSGKGTPATRSHTLLNSDQGKLGNVVESNQKVDLEHVYSQLQRAQLGFETIGIKLVEEKDTSTTVSLAEEGESDVMVSPIVFVRRSDQDVVIDLLQAIKALVRVRGKNDQTGAAFFPFMGSERRPCFCPERNSQTPAESSMQMIHPAVKGIQLAVEAVCLMDTFCPLLPASHPLGEGHEKTWVGLHDRSNMVDKLIHSLYAEITEVWAYQDRHSLEDAVDAHFDMESPPNGLDKCHENSTGSRHNKRVALIAERTILARLVVSVLLHRQEIDEAVRLFCSYLLSSSPSIALEDFPRSSPVISMCVLDAILSADYPADTSFPNRPTAPGRSLSSWLDRCLSQDRFAMNAHTVVLQTAVCIFNIRSSSNDERVAEIARTELAAFRRIVLHHNTWTLRSFAFPGSLTSCREQAAELVTHIFGMPKKDSRSGELTLFSWTLGLALIGDIKTIEDVILTIQREPEPVNLLHLWHPYVVALRQLMVSLSSLLLRSKSTPVHKRVLRFIIGMMDKFMAMTAAMTTSSTPSLTSRTTSTFLLCCIDMGAGEEILRLFSSSAPKEALLTLTDVSDHVVKKPVVRVIALERRKDRLATFRSLICREHILFVRGVTSLHPSREMLSKADSLFGFHAFDGQGNSEEAKEALSQMCGGDDEISALVKDMWRPNNLKEFDKAAPDTEAAVALSSSEKACALSHIATWKGILNTLTPLCKYDLVSGSRPLYRAHFISGYAKGVTFFSVPDEHAGPTPVCVVLEDDAVLVDRFVDRLNEVLEELPRDFHFCSIGYGRPKSAPLIPYSAHLSVPTATWYLTGYVISLQGAKYLLDSLPVEGPIDTWIGQKMFANWKGFNLGGSYHQDVPVTDFSKKDIKAASRFRAFAATSTLCSQRVGSSESVHRSDARKWRQRDTDIVYSGDMR